MSAIGVLLWVIAAYYAVGVLVAIRFVLVVAPRADPAYRGAPWRVRLLFFPGAVAVWPVTFRIARFAGKDGMGDEHES